MATTTEKTPQDETDLNDVAPEGQLSKIDPESAEALDKLLEEANKEKKEEDEGSEDKNKPAEGENKPAEGENKPADGESKDQNKSKEGENKPAEGENKLAEDKNKPAADSPKDEFDDVALPPYTKPKASEAFEKVKSMAREKVSKAVEENEKLKQELEKTKTEKSGLSEQEKAELEELRQFRSKMDVEADPSFKEFDGKAAVNIEGIYSRLKEAGFEQSAIEKIKALGGPGEVDWDKLGDKVPSRLKQYIDRKLADNEDLADQKKSAVDKAKSNISEYVKTRQEETQKISARRGEEVNSEVQRLIPNLTWLKEVSTTDKSTPEEKSRAQAHNKLLVEVKEDLKQAMADDSPTMKAILSVAFLQYRKLKSDMTDIEAKHTQAISGKEKEIGDLKKQLEEKDSLIKRIKNSSTSRLRDSSAPSNDDLARKKTNNLNEPSGDVLDRLRQEIESAKD